MAVGHLVPEVVRQGLPRDRRTSDLDPLEGEEEDQGGEEGEKCSGSLAVRSCVEVDEEEAGPAWAGPAPFVGPGAWAGPGAWGGTAPASGGPGAACDGATVAAVTAIACCVTAVSACCADIASMYILYKRVCWLGTAPWPPP
jgi:hypothetical protein